jgi:crotonobetainyl-CoA:carnitine CoA-transferase CaiB-like acyl-CoA transferase
VLNDLRVLDLSTEVGLMCGQILADMGADVQQWVRPEHSALLDTAFWRAYTVGKGVRVVDWDRDIEALERALESADVLVESESPAFWAQLGLDDAAFEERFPSLIRVSVRHFGRTGPKADYAATDLTALAASGHLYVSGAADAAPLRISVPQAHGHAAADAAVGTVIALLERARSGRGQLVDVSAQQSTTFPLLSRGLDGAVGQEKAMRSAYGSQIGDLYLRSQFEAKDGPVLILQGILPPLAAFMERLMAWVHEAGHIDARHLEHDWGQVAMKMGMGQIGAAEWNPVQEGIAALVADHSKKELMEESVRRRLLVAPILALDDVLDGAQLAAREFLNEGPDGRRLGPFARLSETPLPLAVNEPREWSGASAYADVDIGGEGELPLAGLKVLDVFWVVAGPGATRMLADYGATVIHVESSQRLDMVRNVPPYVEGVADPERAGCHHSTNANKLNITLDLGSEAGREVLADLIRWADVFTESFAPGVIERMGFGYEAVRALNPDIVMISSSLMGQTGPWSGYAGYGNSAAAVTGFHALAGRPGEQPTGCYGPYTDFTSVRFNALAILAAVMHRRRSGRGQHIDMAQAEAALHFLAPACLDYLESGTVAAATGNRDALHVPHGVFPTLGDDRWIAVAVRSDEEWQRLAEVMDRSDLADLSVAKRRERESDLEALITEWTSVRDGLELETELQQLGIPAHRVLDTAELHEDAQLRHRNHFLPVGHRDFDGAMVESTRLILSRTSARTPEIAPWFGVHNEEVLTSVLGYEPGRVTKLQNDGVLR